MVTCKINRKSYGAKAVFPIRFTSEVFFIIYGVGDDIKYGIADNLSEYITINSSAENQPFYVIGH